MEENSDSAAAKALKKMHGGMMFEDYMKYLSDESLFLKKAPCFRHLQEQEATNSHKSRKGKIQYEPCVT